MMAEKPSDRDVSILPEALSQTSWCFYVRMGSGRLQLFVIASSQCLLLSPESGEGLHLLGGQRASGAADGGGLLGTQQHFAQAQSPPMAVGRTGSQGGAAAAGH